MNGYLIYLPLAPYLRDWFINRHGGEYPVRLNRSSEESQLLRSLTTLPPEDYVPTPAPEGHTAVVIPSYAGRDPRVYNHVGPKGISSLVQTITANFDFELQVFLRKNLKPRIRKDELINAWMELKHIEPTETNWCAIVKRYDRLRHNLNVEEYRRRKKSK